MYLLFLHAINTNRVIVSVRMLLKSIDKLFFFWLHKTYRKTKNSKGLFLFLVVYFVNFGFVLPKRTIKSQ